MAGHRPENPLIVQSDQTVLAEVASPRFHEARDRLARFAELVKSPEHVHTYRITPLSVWCAAGADPAEIVEGLRDLAKYPVPANVESSIRDAASRYGRLRLVRDAEGLVLSGDDPALLELVSRVKGVALLQVFLGLRLFPFGAARLARTADGVPCVGLTPAGRYLLGATETFEYAPPPAGEVLVQPDFEIVFLAPAPRLEPEMARFAERIGAGVGALFRITRASAIRAAEQGLTSDQVVGSLEQVARGGVPANVARQLRDWMGSTRRVALRPAVLIECPDADTATRVRAAGGKQVEALTATVLRVKAQGKDRTALVKRLREKGIFVSD